MLRGITLAAALAIAAFGAGGQADAAAMPARPDKVVTVQTKAGATTTQHITLALDKAAIVQLDTDARDVLVSNPDIVDAVVRTPRRIFLLAQKTGQTNAFFFDAAGHQILAIDIRVERDVADLAALIKTNMPGSAIKADALNDNVVLTGTVSSAMEAQRAMDLAVSFAGDPKKVVNMIKINAREQVLLNVRVAEVQRTIAKQFGIDISTVVKTAGVPIVASTDNQFALLGRALSDLSGAQIGEVCKTTQLLPQVVPGASGVPSVVYPGQTVNPLGYNPGGAINVTGTTLGFSPNLLCNADPNNAQGVYRALERVGLMHTLAEPNLTAVSGETAKFLAGGEFPVPASRDRDGNITVEFKQFGVGLSFTPVVMSENRISLHISTEVSELTDTGSFTLASAGASNTGLTIPALSVRRAETTLEVPSGGSFAMAGLLQHTSKQSLDSFPGAKDLPILGALFRSRDYQNNESELVIMITAYLVDPVSQKKIQLPTDGFVPSTDVETILMGKLNSTDAVPDKPAIKSASGGDKYGFIVQ